MRKQIKKLFSRAILGTKAQHFKIGNPTSSVFIMFGADKRNLHLMIARTYLSASVYNLCSVIGANLSKLQPSIGNDPILFYQKTYHREAFNTVSTITNSKILLSDLQKGGHHDASQVANL